MSKEDDMRTLITILIMLCTLCTMQAAGVDIYSPDAGSYLEVSLDSLEAVAWQAYQQQRFDDAAAGYLALLRYNVDDSGNIYNLACCYGLLNKPELAALYLQRAWDAGYTHIEHMSTDPDFDAVRAHPAFAATMQRLQEEAKTMQAEFDELRWLAAPTLMPMYVKLPDTGDGSPDLVLALHGLGDRPDRFIRLAQEFDGQNVIFVALQAPYAIPAGKGVGYCWATGSEEAPELWDSTGALTIDYIHAATQELERLYDFDHLYLMGFSQGCGFTYMAGLTQPELYDGLLCFGGWLEGDEILSEKTLQAAKDMPVFIAHGTQDHIVEFYAAEGARDRLQAAGYDLVLRPFEGGHTVDRALLKEGLEWLREL